jgi:hypothetical protein
MKLFCERLRANAVGDKKSKMDPIPGDAVKEEVVQLANKDGWSYRINCSKIIKGKKTFYMCCSNYQTPGILCMAKKTIVQKGNVLEITRSPRVSHNHDPPSRVRVCAEIKEAISVQAKNHVKPEQIRANLTQQFPGQPVGSKAQVRYLANKAFGLPSGDEIAQILEVGKDFVQELSLISGGQPDFRMICWSKSGLKALCRWGKMVFMDGTHNVLENGLTLTCLMVRVNGGEGFVGAWMVHQTKTIGVYEIFLRSVSAACGGKWIPSLFVLDFEIAEKVAVLSVFPDCNVSLCSFHLFQSIRRWFQEHQISDEDTQSRIFHQIQLLQTTTSRAEFAGQCSTSLPLLSKLCPLFYEYFYNNYVKSGSRYPSELWSSYISQNFENRTNNIAESQNHKIKTRIGRGLSELKFVVKAKEYSEAQVLLLVSEHNKSWKQLLSEPLIEVIFFFSSIN